MGDKKKKNWILLSKKEKKQGDASGYLALQPGGVRWPTAAPSAGGGRRRGPSHAHPDTRARTVPTLHTLGPPPPRHDAPRAHPAPSPPEPPAPGAQSPRPPPGPRSDGGGAALPGVWAAGARGPARAGSPASLSGPEPGSRPAAPTSLGPSGASRRRRRPPARSLPPSAGPPRVVACAGSPPGVTAPAAESPHAGTRGGARAARAPRPERAPRRRAPLPGSARRAIASPVVPRTGSAAALEGPGTPRRAGLGAEGLGGGGGRRWRHAQPLVAQTGGVPSRLPSRVPRGHEHMLLCLGRLDHHEQGSGQTVVVALIGTPLRGPPPALPPG
ncbi:basic proline-rich protein-like [Prionailurus bengalensis]|uniref:basic proline-rich protein-like n=1 Tax=Prionailurus bengalensis TaxID=37029 RepID=UPI001CA94CE4|nr:basic proline-rich protein-like [Prionailurus bengalensis]